MRQWEERLERAESSDEESSNADSSLVPNIDQEDVVVNVDDDSSNGDIVDETVKECMRSWYLLFTLFRANKASNKRKLRPVPSIVKRVNSTEANANSFLMC